MNTTTAPVASLSAPQAQRHIPVRAIVIISAIGVVGIALMQFEGTQYVSHGQVVSSSGDTPTVYLSGAEPKIAAKPASPMREVHIANNGLTLLRGARVVDMSGTELTVAMQWDSSSYAWKIVTDAKTKYIKSNGDPGSVADIKEGDYITVSGQLAAGAEDPAITAQFVHD